MQAIVCASGKIRLQLPAESYPVVSKGFLEDLIVLL
jgi:hypothetical protein